MAKDSKETLSREERLAAKLRENLRRRKAQGRQQDPAHSNSGEPDTETGVPKDASES